MPPRLANDRFGSNPDALRAAPMAASADDLPVMAGYSTVASSALAVIGVFA